MAETATGLFRDVEVGERFRSCWTYGVERKVDAPDHNAELVTLEGIVICYNIPWFRQIRQDAYTEMEAQ